MWLDPWPGCLYVAVAPICRAFYLQIEALLGRVEAPAASSYGSVFGPATMALVDFTCIYRVSVCRAWEPCREHSIALCSASLQGSRPGTCLFSVCGPPGTAYAPEDTDRLD